MCSLFIYFSNDWQYENSSKFVHHVGVTAANRGKGDSTILCSEIIVKRAKQAYKTKTL
jgi:hypothetical protein